MSTETSEGGGESVYSKEYRRLRSLTSTIEIQRQCVSYTRNRSHLCLVIVDCSMIDLGSNLILFVHTDSADAQLKIIVSTNNLSRPPRHLIGSNDSE